MAYYADYTGLMVVGELTKKNHQPTTERAAVLQLIFEGMQITNERC